MTLSPGICVFLFPHQDDEFGVFHVIEKSIRAGLRPVCIYLTDGGANPAVTPEIRNQESMHVLANLGVPEKDIFFTGTQNHWRDGELYKHMSAAYADIQRILSAYGSVEQLYFPAWEGGHQDHDVAHVLGVRLAYELNIISRSFQFSLYQGAGLPSAFFRVLAPLLANGAVMAEKIGWADRLRYLYYCLLYPSQKRSWLGLFPFVVLHYVLAGTQQLQAVSRDRMLEPPHAGQPLYERRKFCSWDTIEKACAAFMTPVERGHDA